MATIQVLPSFQPPNSCLIVQSLAAQQHQSAAAPVAAGGEADTQQSTVGNADMIAQLTSLGFSVEQAKAASARTVRIRWCSVTIHDDPAYNISENGGGFH